MNEKFEITPTVLSNFFNRNYANIIYLGFWVRKDKTISCEVGKLEDNGKIRKIPAINAIFSKWYPEPVHFEGIVQAKTKNSGKKRFHDFGRATQYVKRRSKIVNGKRQSIYVEVKDEKASMILEMLFLEIQYLIPILVEINHCKYWKYILASGMEVYCSKYNDKLARFFRDAGDKEFTYV